MQLRLRAEQEFGNRHADPTRARQPMRSARTGNAVSSRTFERAGMVDCPLLDLYRADFKVLHPG